MEKDLIIIVTMNRYPNGDAGAVRQHAMARLLIENGYDVFVIGYGEKKNKTNKFEDVPYTSMKTSSNNIIMRLISRITFGRKVIRYIRGNFNRVKGILVVNRSTRFVFEN